MTNKKDYLDGDHSFKKWFEIMWRNGYIFVFLIGFGGMVTQVVMWDDMIEMVQENYAWSTWGGFMATTAMLLPLTMTSIVSYKGFWQFWNDLKNGKRR